MDSEFIEKLLNRYWNSETTVEEESLLRDFFNGNEVPASLLPYRDLFVYQRQSASESLGIDFDRRIMSMTEAPVVKARRVTLSTRLMPMFRAAAVVVAILALGSVMRHSFYSEVHEFTAVDTIGEQISAPSVAISDEVVGAEQKGDSVDIPVDIKVLEKGKMTE